MESEQTWINQRSQKVQMRASKLVIRIKSLTYSKVKIAPLLNIDILEVIWLKYTRSYALSFLRAKELFNTFDVCDRARGFRSTTVGLAFSRRTCRINSLANFLHRTQLPVFQGVCSHYCLYSITLLTQCLHPHFVTQRHLTLINSVLKHVLYKNYPNSFTKN